MLIDWFTVIAQIINFLILVWLLKRFLYKPILNAIDAREKKVARELADAAAKMTEATREREEFQRKNETFDRERAALMSQAVNEAKAERLRLLDAARKDADDLSARRRETLMTDAHNLNQSLSRRTQQEVFSIARKTLADLADANLEERMAGIFMRQLRELNAQARTSLGTTLRNASEPVLIRSAFALPAAQCTAIQNALNETFSAQIPVRFETVPELIGGIELIANGQKLAWSIAEYLASLENGVNELLKSKAQTRPAPASSATGTKPV